MTGGFGLTIPVQEVFAATAMQLLLELIDSSIARFVVSFGPVVCLQRRIDAVFGVFLQLPGDPTFNC